MNKQNRRSSRKMTPAGIVLRIIIVLLCLIVLSVYFMDGLYARYVSNGTGSDSARVAKFEVDVVGDADVAISTMVSTDNVYTITITNRSEVDISYELKVDVDPALLGTFTDGTGYLNPGESITATLTFEVMDWNAVTQGMQNAQDSKPYDFTVTVNAVQVD